MEIKLEQAGKVMVVVVLDKKLDHSNIREFMVRMDQILGSSEDIAVDAEKLEFIDSSGFSGFATILDHVREKRGRFCIFNVQEDVKDALHMVRLERLMNIYNSRQEALDSFE